MQQPPRKPKSTSLDRDLASEITAAKQKKSKAPVSFTEEELDRILSLDAIDQEVKRMASKGLLPSQKQQKVVADVADAYRWQEAKDAELKQMKTGDATNQKPWITDLMEDFVTYGLSPANTDDEAKVILDSLGKELEVHSNSGFGPDARNYIVALRKELELLIEKL